LIEGAFVAASMTLVVVAELMHGLRSSSANLSIANFEGLVTHVTNDFLILVAHLGVSVGKT
jgi:hypothetical protein